MLNLFFDLITPLGVVTGLAVLTMPVLLAVSGDD